MIQANELRIGNYFETSNINYSKVTSIKQYNVYCESYFPHELELCKPIPLTEEILLKCGFEGKLTFWKGLLGVSLLDGITMINEFNYDCEYLHVRTRYLHQLQNLYFALTGEELDIKL